MRDELSRSQILQVKSAISPAQAQKRQKQFPLSCPDIMFSSYLRVVTLITLTADISADADSPAKRLSTLAATRSEHRVSSTTPIQIQLVHRLLPIRKVTTHECRKDNRHGKSLARSRS